MKLLSVFCLLEVQSIRKVWKDETETKSENFHNYIDYISQ